MARHVNDEIPGSAMPPGIPLFIQDDDRVR